MRALSQQLCQTKNCLHTQVDKNSSKSKSCIRLSMSGSAAEATDPTLTVKFWGNRFRVAVEASEDV